MPVTTETLYAILPLLPPAWLLFRLVDNPIQVVTGWLDLLFSWRHEEGAPREVPRVSTVGSQLLIYLTMAILGYIATYRLVPNIKVEFCLCFWGVLMHEVRPKSVLTLRH